MSDELQFEKAEFSAPRSVICSACQRPIVHEYFGCNGQILCADCATKFRRQLAGEGSGAARFARALFLGVGAALLGAAVYAAIMIGAHMELALVSIAIGYFVGKAVRMGSAHRGGWRYQVLAAFLTYSAICAAYAAGIWHDLGSPNSAQISLLAGHFFILPFEGGAENVLGWLIIGFGVFQAWQINRGTQVQITGPHALSGAPVAS